MKLFDGIAVLYAWGGSVVLAFLLGAAVTYFFDPAKRDCETKLPRDVECVWSAPIEFTKEHL